jgi:hypothetical protein
MKVGMRKVPLAQVSPMALSFVFAIVWTVIDGLEDKVLDFNNEGCKFNP